MEPAYSVTSLTLAIKRKLEDGTFARVAVEGELTNVRRHGSGHVYLVMKDEGACLGAVIWRSTAERLRVRPADGMQVVAHGRVEVYPPQGKYQLIVDGLEPAGLGRLLAELERLKQRLAAEGLFAAERKRPLPFLPRRVGVVTAPGGAALRDILKTLSLRFPTRVLLYAARVQGDGAALEIARGIEALGRVPDVDVIICGRGGGSLEDLWPFHDERVVRAIAASPKPVVSAVGHEVDVLLSDLAADHRAATPTAAAEAVVPRMRDLLAFLEACDRRLADAARRRVREAAQGLDHLDRRLGHGARRRFEAGARRLGELRGRLRNLHPRLRLAAARARLEALARRLDAAGRATVADRRRRLEHARRTLAVLSPTANLDRGFAIVRDREGRVLREASQAAPGDGLQVLLRKGALDVSVEGVQDRHAFEPEPP